MPDSNVGDDDKPFGSKMIGTTQSAAALLLVESLIHGLLKRSLLTVDEAIEIVDVAADVEREMDATGQGPPFGDFLSLLAPIASSLRVDLRE